MQVKRAFQEVKRVESFFAGHTIKLLLVVDYTIYRRSKGHIPKILKRTLDVANGIHQVNPPSILFMNTKYYLIFLYRSIRSLVRR